MSRYRHCDGKPQGLDPIDAVMVDELDAFEVRAAIREEQLRDEREAEERAVERMACAVCGSSLVPDRRDETWLVCIEPECGHLVRAVRPVCSGCAQPMNRSASMQWCPACRLDRHEAYGFNRMHHQGRRRECMVCKRKRTLVVHGVCASCRKQGKANG
jgi:hypothetical protein